MTDSYWLRENSQKKDVVREFHILDVSKSFVDINHVITESISIVIHKKGFTDIKTNDFVVVKDNGEYVNNGAVYRVINAPGLLPGSDTIKEIPVIKTGFSITLFNSLFESPEIQTI